MGTAGRASALVSGSYGRSPVGITDGPGRGSSFQIHSGRSDHVQIQDRAVGAVGAYAPGLRPWLAGQGYAEASQTACVRLCAVLSRWLQARRVDPAMLSDRRVARFAAEHRVADGHVPGLAPVLRYLRTTGVIPAGGEPGLVDREVEAFRRYLNEARQLAPTTVGQRCDVVRRFLSGGEVDGTLELSGLCVVEVHRFVMAEAARLRRGSITAVLHAMRSFLRYLFASVSPPPTCPAACRR